MSNTDNNIEELKRILEDMINEKIPIHLGCHRLSGMYHSGNEIVWYDFDEYYNKLNDIPLPSQYLLWNEVALEVKLKKLDEYKVQVLGMAEELLKEIRKF
ncbi:hypothetical protein [Paenibacillus lautus]|uniref:hypothetical protein n=1 Tax=Paenibacillus lautus TaxID=1401 RepID=UPI003D2B345E